MSEVVAWDWARRAAALVASQLPGPRDQDLQLAPVSEDLRAAVADAAPWVSESSGIQDWQGNATPVVLDRIGWVEVNITAFQILMEPMLEKLEERLSASPLAPLSRVVAGVQIGGLLGWLSGRVLGQYDVTQDNEPGTIYFVGNNLISLESRYGFAPDEFRRWVAVHELAHAAQFDGVGWLRPYFLGEVRSMVSSFELDPRVALARVAEAMRRILEGDKGWRDMGLVGLVATSEQLALARRLQALMSLLEGHADVVMEKASAGRISGAERFKEILRRRRRAPEGLARLIQRALGIDAKTRQYEEGERFLKEAEALVGAAGLSRLWHGPENLPSPDELADPARWVARVAS